MIDCITPIYGTSESKIRTSPCHVNRASDIAHDCERYLVYSRTRWADRAPHDVHLQRIFDEGSLHERAVMAELAAAGVEVLEQQRPLDDLFTTYKITGHIDGVMVDKTTGKAVILEIKSASDHIWKTIAREGPGVYRWEEVAPAFSTRPWLRKYYGQVQIYMLAKDGDEAVILFKNKGTGEVAQVEVDLDYDYAEGLLQRAERINRYVDRNEVPDRMPFDHKVCGKCGFKDICLPDMPADPVGLYDDETICSMCVTREALDAARKEYKETDDVVKSWAKIMAENRIVLASDEHGTWEILKKTSGKTTRITIRRASETLGEEGEEEEE